MYNEERNLINKDILKLRRQNHFKYAFLIEKESRDLKSLYNDQGVKIYKFVIVIAAFGLIQYVFTWVLFQYFINLT